MFPSKAFALFCFLTGTIIMVGNSYAAKNVTNAQALSFGKVVKPSSGSVQIVINNAGAVQAATTATRLGGTLSGGRNLIFKNNNDTIDVVFSDCSSGSDGLALSNFTATYKTFNFTNSRNGMTAPSNPSSPIIFGATLTISSTATVGIKTVCYNVDVQYN